MLPVGFSQGTMGSAGVFGGYSAAQNSGASAVQGGGASAFDSTASAAGLSGAQQDAATGLLPDAAAAQDALLRSKAEAKVMQNQFDGACRTCKERMYQDGSNDPGVSFKNAATIDPGMAASVVLGHEMEHVMHEKAKVESEGGEIVSQNIVLHTGICPECGRTYIAGGTTQTVSRSAAASGYAAANANEKAAEGLNASA